MDIRELLRLPPPGAIPRAPKVTLATVANKVNGHKGDPQVLGEGLAMISTARNDWKNYIAKLEQHRAGADEEKRLDLRQKLESAAEILGELEEGETLLVQDRAAAQKAVREAAAAKERAALAERLRRFARERVEPMVNDSLGLLRSVESLRDRSMTAPALQLLTFITGYVRERGAAFELAVAQLEQKPAPPPAHEETPAPRQAAATAPHTPRPHATPQPFLASLREQHPAGPKGAPMVGAFYVGRNAISPSPPPTVVRLRAERAPDARVEDLKPGEALVECLSSGYSPADDQPQCYATQRIIMSELRARHAESIGKVRIITTYPQGESAAAP